MPATSAPVTVMRLATSVIGAPSVPVFISKRMEIRSLSSSLVEDSVTDVPSEVTDSSLLTLSTLEVDSLEDVVCSDEEEVVSPVSVEELLLKEGSDIGPQEDNSPAVSNNGINTRFIILFSPSLE